MTLVFASGKQELVPVFVTLLSTEHLRFSQVTRWLQIAAGSLDMSALSLLSAASCAHVRCWLGCPLTVLCTSQRKLTFSPWGYNLGKGWIHYTNEAS